MCNNICYVCYEGESDMNKFLPDNICQCSQSNRLHEKCHALLTNKYRCSICKSFYKNIGELTTDTGLRIINEFDNLGFRHEYTVNSNGRKHGYHKIWYHNGNLWEENYYVDGARQGVQKLYSFAGQLYRELRYDDGVRTE
jgi:hypothetical protein